MKKLITATLLLTLVSWSASAETPDEWVKLGARVHGGFGSFIPLGIKIGPDVVNRLNAKPHELTVLYYDSDKSPCACFADGIAIATYASVGQRTLKIASERPPTVRRLSSSFAHAKAAPVSNTRSRYRHSPS